MLQALSKISNVYLVHLKLSYLVKVLDVYNYPKLVG